MTYRYLFGLAIGLWVMVASYFLWSMLSIGTQHGTMMGQVGMLWVGIGLVAAWTSRVIKDQHKKIMDLEGRLSRLGTETPSESTH